MRQTRLAAISIYLVLLTPLQALSAGMFPDVPAGHPFIEHIEALVRGGAIHGNPDGTFRPSDNVSRAAMLKMLYLAAGRQPKGAQVGCFSDVERFSWYEDFVCDAASKENGFVEGFGDNTFRPADPVTRTQALKMVLNITGLLVSDISTGDRNVINFADVTPAAWYAKYLSASYDYGILPVAGQTGDRFHPDKPLNRGEAAAYINKAVTALEAYNAGLAARQSSSPPSSTSKPTDRAVSKEAGFPFYDTFTFPGKQSVSYTFMLGQPMVLNSVTRLTDSTDAKVTCRLYLLNESDFSDEYYLGMSYQGACYLNVAVRPGKYQLQLQSNLADATFTMDTKTGTGDGNDGFREARKLSLNRPVVGILEANDIADWYKFTVTEEKEMIVEIGVSETIDCIIHPGKDIDQFGFTGPECDKPYLYKPGEYTVGVTRRIGPLAKTVQYVLNWK